MAKFTDSPKLGDRFCDALVFAHQVHLNQIRKGNVEVPYISHLLAVASLVLESGGSEDEAIAALLHDCIEDVNVSPQLIEDKFGSNVNCIIYQLTEDKTLPKQQRKVAYAQSILDMSLSALRVSVADKLHNIRCYALNPELWEQEQHDFYVKLLNNYEQRDVEDLNPLLVEIDLLFQQLS